MTKKSINQSVVNYLKNRGIKRQTAEFWEVGYLPTSSKLLSLTDKQVLYDTRILIKRGGISPLEKYVTFPLYDSHDRLIGFSGRTLLSNQKKRKYWHSALEKKRFLFGLNKAKEGIRRKGYAIVTEGQFDVMIAHQNGLDNVVGTMGTALTSDQIILLSRYTDTIYVAFDGDEAGKKALENQINKHQREDPKLIPFLLPDNYDVDSYLREFGKNSFLNLLSTFQESSSPNPLDL